MSMKITIKDSGVEVHKSRRLVDPDTGDEVLDSPHSRAVGLLNYMPRDTDGDPDLSDPTKVEEAKAKARDEIKALIEDVAGPEFAELAGRIKAAEDERDLHRAEAERLRNENAELKRNRNRGD